MKLWSLFSLLVMALAAMQPSAASDPVQAEELGLEPQGLHLSAPDRPSAAARSEMPSGTVVIVPDSIANRLVALSPVDGSLIDDNLFELAGGTPVHAVQVGQEIWISEQIGDRISRWSLQGEALGAVGADGGLDNIRGMALLEDQLLVTNAGTNNGAPGAAIVRVSLDGNIIGHVGTSATSSSPFEIQVRDSDLLVASSSAGDDIHRYDFAIASLGTFHDTTSLNFAQQMAIADNGDILAAGFSSNNIVRLNPNNGELISQFPASGARGVLQLSNGNILWSNSSGVHVYDVSAQTSSLVYSGGARHFSIALLPLDEIFADRFEE